MHRTFQVFQLNVGKRNMVQQNVMNYEQLRDFSVPAISEPHMRRNDEGTIVTSPMGHSNRTRFTPTAQRDDGWMVRSIMWVRKDIEAEKVPVQSADLTAVVLQLHDRAILVRRCSLPEVDRAD